MDKKLSIIAIPGSLRTKSLNRMLINAVAELGGTRATIDVATIQDIPLYNQDDEDNKGIPKATDLFDVQSGLKWGQFGFVPCV